MFPYANHVFEEGHIPPPRSCRPETARCWPVTLTIDEFCDHVLNMTEGYRATIKRFDKNDKEIWPEDWILSFAGFMGMEKSE